MEAVLVGATAGAGADSSTVQAVPTLSSSATAATATALMPFDGTSCAMFGFGKHRATPPSATGRATSVSP